MATTGGTARGRTRRATVPRAVGAGAIIAVAAWALVISRGPVSGASADPASSCRGLGASSDEVLAFPSAQTDLALCVVRSGTAPDIRTALYVNGTLTAAFQDDACSWPNAANSLSVATVHRDDGRVVAWGTLPEGTERVAATTETGKRVEMPALGVAGPRVFAAVLLEQLDFPTLEAVGRKTGGTAAVAACAQVRR